MARSLRGKQVQFDNLLNSTVCAAYKRLPQDLREQLMWMEKGERETDIGLIAFLVKDAVEWTWARQIIENNMDFETFVSKLVRGISRVISLSNDKLDDEGLRDEKDFVNNFPVLISDLTRKCAGNCR